MSIVDSYTDKTHRVQTDQGQVYISKDFTIEQNVPIHGFVRITDNGDGTVYWFNINAISWIGPRA